jgi:hypothetical protein
MVDKKIEEIIELNNFLDKHLNLKNLKDKHLDIIFEKIAVLNLQRYQNNFKTLEEYRTYLKEVANYIKKIYYKDNIQKEHLFKLHYLTNKKIRLNNKLPDHQL